MAIRGTAVRMGWEKRKGGDRFRIVIELNEPPTWPIDVVWSARPILLELEQDAQTKGKVLMPGIDEYMDDHGQ
jgi:hypothetical protein